MGTLENSISTSAESLLTTHYDGLVKFAQNRLGDVEKARDLVQKTCLKIIEACPLDNQDNPKSYLFTTANHLYLNELRNSKRRATISLDESSISRYIHDPSPYSDPETTTIYRAFVDRLGLGIKSLLPRERQVLALSYEGTPNAQAAEAMGISLGAAKALLNRTRNKLRKFLDEDPNE